MQTINLDCAPGMVRPADLIEGVLADTGLDVPATGATIFGSLTWAFDVPRETWVRDIQPIVAPRIKDLYHAGMIRHGDW